MNDEHPTPTTGRGRAILTLLTGLLSLPTALLAGIGLIFGLFALGVGSRALARSAPGRALTLVGMSTGLIGTLVSCVMLLVLFSSIVLPRLEAGAARAVVDDRVEISFTTIDGTTITGEDLDGRRVVLDVFATWCGPCLATFPALDRLAGEDEAMVIGITFEPAEHVRYWTDSRRSNGRGPSYPVVAMPRDTLPAAIAGVQSYPTMYVLDGDQVIREVLVGAHRYERLQQAVAGVPLHAEPTDPETEPAPESDDDS